MNITYSYLDQYKQIGLAELLDYFAGMPVTPYPLSIAISKATEYGIAISKATEYGIAISKATEYGIAISKARGG